MERLQKFLSRAGVASRRHAETLIVDGRVKVNGKVVTELGTKVDGKDLVLLDGKLVSPNTERQYFLLYKPPGVVTTLSDPEGRPTIADYARETQGRVFPVGRLDYDAEGAIILTDDGTLANKLMHPSHEVPRVYLAKVKGVPDEASLAKLVAGVRLEDGMAKATEARIFNHAKRNTWVKLIVTEGRQHLVKRLCAAIGHPVVRLFRPAHAGISVHGLRPGEMRALSNDEIRRVKAAGDGDAQPQPSLYLPGRRHGHAAPGFEPDEDDDGDGPSEPVAQPEEPKSGKFSARDVLAGHVQRPVRPREEESPVESEEAPREETKCEPGAFGRKKRAGDKSPGSFGREKREAFEKREPGAFGGKREGGFEKREPGAFGGKREGGFEKREPGAFGGKREGGFEKREPGAFGGKREGGFEKREPGAFGREKREPGAFGGKREGGFEKREPGAFGRGKREPGAFGSKREPGAFGREKREPGAFGSKREPGAFGREKRESGDKREGGFKKREFGDKREGGFKKFGEKREGGFKKREFGDKREGGFKKFGEKREGGFKKREFGDKREGGFKKFGEKREGGFKKREFGDKREGGFKKFGEKREGGFKKREFGDKREGGGFKKREFGDKREGGFKKREGGFGEKREGGKFKPRGEGGRESRFAPRDVNGRSGSGAKRSGGRAPPRRSR